MADPGSRSIEELVKACRVLTSKPPKPADNDLIEWFVSQEIETEADFLALSEESIAEVKKAPGATLVLFEQLTKFRRKNATPILEEPGIKMLPDSGNQQGRQRNPWHEDLQNRNELLSKLQEMNKAWAKWEAWEQEQYEAECQAWKEIPQETITNEPPSTIINGIGAVAEAPVVVNQPEATPEASADAWVMVQASGAQGQALLDDFLWKSRRWDGPLALGPNPEVMAGVIRAVTGLPSPEPSQSVSPPVATPIVGEICEDKPPSNLPEDPIAAGMLSEGEM